MTPVTYGPYTPLKQAGEHYWTSGQVGVDQQTRQAPKSIEAQTSQALTNLQAVLETNGLSMRDVVKTTIYLTNMTNYADVNSIYEGFFEAPRPARTCVAVAELPRVGGKTKLLIEIEAIAFKGGN